MKKYVKMRLLVLLLLGLGGLYYFFVLPYDYQVRFSTHNAPWLIYHLVKINQEDTQFIKEEDKRLVFSSSSKNKKTSYRYTWELEQENDETVVRVKAVFTKERWKEKVLLLFGNSSHVKSMVNEIKSFTTEIVNSSKEYKWEKPVAGTLPAANCLCTTISARIEDKASQMNQTISMLSSYLPDGKKSPPRLYITALDLEKQNMKFDFCFPFEKLPIKTIDNNSIFITFKPEIKGEVIKFYGNYSQTHRAWFSYMASKSITTRTELNFVEVFYDSPFGGIEQTKWKSEVYFKI